MIGIRDIGVNRIIYNHLSLDEDALTMVDIEIYLTLQSKFRYL